MTIFETEIFSIYWESNDLVECLHIYIRESFITHEEHWSNVNSVWLTV